MPEHDQPQSDDKYPNHLLPQHLGLLTKARLSAEVVRLRGYRSAKSRKDLLDLGFQPRQGNVPALVIPIHGVDGQKVNHLIRPDSPRIKQERRIKYELPKGTTLRIDVPPACLVALADTTKELWIADGPIQADAMASARLTCIALLGPHGWRHFLKPGKPVLADWPKIQLEGRTVNTAFGSDV